MKYTLVVGIFCCNFLYTSAQLPEGRRSFPIPSLSDILTSPNALNTKVVDLSPSSGEFGNLQGGFGGLNDGFISPASETGSGVRSVNELVSTSGGVAASSGGIASVDEFVNEGSAIKSAGHGHSHGPEIQNKDATNVGQNIITDTLGNVPPPPSGVHVDLPGEHGNPHDFPVIHHGESPIQVSPEDSTSAVNDRSNDFHPNSLAAERNKLQGLDNSVPVPMESSHRPHTVTHGPANIDQSKNPFHATNVHNIAGRPVSKGGNFEDLTLSQDNGNGFINNGVLTVDGLLDLPQDSFMISTNHASDKHHSKHKNMESSASRTDGLMSQSDGFLTPLSEGQSDITPQSFDIDLPGQHHTPIDGVSVSHIENAIGNTHIDMPGQHGVRLHGNPVVHREGNIMQPNQGGPVANVHVDMPGEHNNQIDGEPVIHREIKHGGGPHFEALDGNIPDHLSAVGHIPSIISEPKAHQVIGAVPETLGNENHHIDLNGIHIDAPGVHGNMLNEPALHLPPGATVQDAIAAGIIPDPSIPAADELQTGTGLEASNTPSIGNVHVDLPGEHDNPMDILADVRRNGDGGLGQRNEHSIKKAEIGVKVDSVHVDLPGQHNNLLDGMPVIHREGPQRNGDKGFSIMPSELSSSSSIFGPQSSGNVHVDLPGEHGNAGEHPIIHRDLTHIGPQVGVSTGNVHVDLPGEHGNVGEHPVIHRDATHVGPQVGVSTGNVHVDLPGEHGNLGEHPVIHRDSTHIGPQVGVSTGNVHVDLPVEHGNVGIQPVIQRDATHNGPQVGVPIGNVHVDLPGEHGNVGEHPVIHRDATHIGPQVGVPTGNVHVDLPGRHGNVGVQPVIHRDSTDIGPQVGVPMGNVHVDLPGEHGNVGEHPVIHRDTTHIGPQVAVPMGNVHVDLPGEHGNVGVQPVIHRDASSTGPQIGVPFSNVHVDLPGLHNNLENGMPTIHRDALQVGPQIVGTPIGNIHVDLPGQHGNPTDGHSVIHREASHIGPQADIPLDNVHVDIPGQQGISPNGMPTIQREGRHTGSKVDIPIGKVQIDLPGQHGIPPNGMPTIHREATHIGPHVGTPIGNVHVDMPGQHGNPIGNIPTLHREATHIGRNVHNDMAGNHGKPVNGIPTFPAAGLGKPKHSIHPGIHIDAPRGHGNKLNEPVLHLPPGATIEDAQAAGAIPGPMDFGPKGIPKGIVPVVPTGVLPGTKNVPVPKPGGSVYQDHKTATKPNTLHIPRKGKKFGDIFGVPSVHLKESIDINDYGRTNFGIVDGDSVLLKKFSRRRGGRGRKGRKWRKPKTTTIAPKKSDGGGGIKIIHTSRPNPLAVLGNALKSVLSGGNSKGGGLLGSLIRSVVGAQQGPRILARGGVVMRPIGIQPVRRPLYGRILIGK